MKDPIKVHSKQGERLNEIFGWLKRTFGSEPSTTPSSFLDAMKRYQDTDSDTDCAKMDVGKKRNRKVAGTAGEGSVTIGKNKIANIKGIKFELLDAKGKGTGKFDNAIPRDFKCYDESKDIYGIKWLFDENASYEATAISGELKAGVKNQSVNFWGKWLGGTFNGHLFGSHADFAAGSTKGPGAKFSFDTGAAPKTKKGKGKPKGKTKGKPSGPKIAVSSPSATGTVSPMATASTASVPVMGGNVSPMTTGSITPKPVGGTAAPASAPTTTAPKTGKAKGKLPGKPRIKEVKAITMVEFLSKFL